MKIPFDFWHSAQELGSKAVKYADDKLKEESKQTLTKLKEQIMKLQMVTTEEVNVKQLDIQVKVGKETIPAIVDYGADVDYINEEWCRQKEFPVEEIGNGWMEGFDGKQTRIFGMQRSGSNLMEYFSDRNSE